MLPPMPEVTALVNFYGGRIDDLSYCHPGTPPEVCEAVVLNSKWHNWYFADIYYGQSTIYFYAAGLALFTLINILFLYRQRYGATRARGFHNDPIYLWSVSTCRYLFSRQWRIPKAWGYTLTLGHTVAICIMILFFSIMTLADKTYYWPDPNLFGHSPPIATRAGFMAIGILPFQVMFAAKWNPITVLTGFSHEKLQVYHRWSAWIMYVLALIHTFPFIVVNIQLGSMRKTWATDWEYYSGVLCLIPQTGLVLLSIGCIRDRYYETFKSLHYFMAAFFIVVLFLHCNFTQTSAYYFIGFAVTYTLSLIVRWGRAVRNGFHHRAALTVVTPEIVRIDIPTKLKWQPGQHYFFRFFTGDFHSMTSHPFTVASIPSLSGQGNMEVYVKLQRGMTRSLIYHAEKAGIRTLLDGPYGGLGGDLGVYDRVLLLAGGSGASFILSVLRDLVQRKEMNCQSVTVIYACRTTGSGEAFKSAFEEIISTKNLEININYHVTSPATMESESLPGSSTQTPSLNDRKDNEEDIEKEPEIDEKKESHGGILVRSGRPNLPSHIISHARYDGTLGIAACGPNELLFDVRQAVAQEQMNIVKGTVACRECYLHTEVFGW